MVTASVDGPKGSFVVNQSSSDLLAYLVVRQTATTTLKGELVVRHADTGTVLAYVVVRHSDVADLLGYFISRQSGSASTGACFFDITWEAHVMKGVNAGVYRDLGIIG